jgi:hypothetical protein
MFINFLIGVKMKNLKLNYFTDAGHGWVSVKLQTLRDLGIADQISHYSYMRGLSVYLEEDCDLGLLFKTCDAISLKIDLITKHTNKRSPIRSYAVYCAGGVA